VITLSRWNLSDFRLLTALNAEWTAGGVFPSIARSPYMSLGTILIIVLVLILCGVFPSWGYSTSWGYGPSGVVGTVLVVILVLLVLGKI
jgi:hypothetical protein